MSRARKWSSIPKAKDKEKDKDKDKDEDKKNGSDSDEPDFGSQFAQVMKNDTLILSTSPVAIQDILKRWDGKHSETLADVAGLQVDLGVKPRRPHGRRSPWATSTPSLWCRRSSCSTTPGSRELHMAMAFLPVLGFDNLKPSAVRSTWLPTSTIPRSRIQVYLEKAGLGRAAVSLTFPPVKQSPPKWITDDTSSYISLNWDVPKAYAAVEALVDQIMGPAPPRKKLDEWADDDNLKIHLKKDVIDNLDGVIHFATDNPDPNKPDTNALPRRLRRQEWQEDEVRPRQAREIAELPGPTAGLPRRSDLQPRCGRPSQFGNNANQTMGVAVVNDYLMFSTDVSRIEQVIIGDKDRKPLAESAKYRTLAKHFPAQNLPHLVPGARETIEAALRNAS